MKKFSSISQIPARVALQISALSLTIFIADLLTKSWANSVLQYHPWSLSYPSLSWFELSYSENTGIAFGMGFGGVPLILLSVLLIVVFLFYMATELDLNKLSAKIIVSLVLAGALGNLFDRVFLGSVRDFIRVGSWPLFNLADMAIVTGILLLIISLYLPSHGRGKR